MSLNYSRCLSQKYAFACACANLQERQTWKNAEDGGRRTRKRRTQNGTAATHPTREEVTETREEGDAIEREREESDKWDAGRCRRDGKKRKEQRAEREQMQERERERHTREEREDREYKLWRERERETREGRGDQEAKRYRDDDERRQDKTGKNAPDLTRQKPIKQDTTRLDYTKAIQEEKIQDRTDQTRPGHV